MTKITSERVHLSILNNVTFEHIHRYEFAGMFVNDKIVLDIACGTGYGSFYLSQFAKSVYGIDLNEEVIKENKQKYSNSNLHFICSSAEVIPIENNFVDIIVSFETIEHVQSDLKIMSEFKRVLKKDGLLIISTPNKLISDINRINNPFHLKEFYIDDFKKLLSTYFSQTLLLYQASCFASIIVPENIEKETHLDIRNTDVQQLRKGLITPSDDKNWNKYYFLALASEEPISNQNIVSILNANEHIKNLYLLNERIYSSFNYKIGYYLTFPVKLLLHLLKIKKYPDIIS